MTREEAIKTLKELWRETNDQWYEETYAMAIEALSADAVQGEWIDRSNGGRIKYPWWESCECNQCGGYGSGAYNFCPNCGADMRGDTE